MLADMTTPLLPTSKSGEIVKQEFFDHAAAINRLSGAGVYYATSFAGANLAVKAQAAVDYCVANGGGDVVLPAGTHQWDAVLQLPPNLAANVGVRVRGSEMGTTVKLTAAAPRFSDFKRNASNDVHRNLEVSDLIVDCDNVYSPGHKITGTAVPSSSAPTEFSSNAATDTENVAVRRVRVLNCTPGGSGASITAGVWISSRQYADADEGFIRRVYCEDIYVDGANFGVYVGAHVSTSKGVVMDEIHVDGVWHHTRSPANGPFYNGTHVMVGGHGRGGYATVRNVTGYNTGDDGVEINGFTTAVVENCMIYDPGNVGYLSINFGLPLEPAAQTITVRDFKVIVTEAHPPTTNNHTRGFLVNETGHASSAGEFIFERCTYYNRGETHLTNLGQAFRVSTSVMRRVEFIDCDALYEGLSLQAAGDGASAFFIQPDAAGEPSVLIRNCLVRARGVANNIAFTFCGVRAGYTGRLEIDGLDVDLGVTGVNATPPTNAPAAVELGANSGALSGFIRRLRVVNMSDAPTKYAVRSRFSGSFGPEGMDIYDPTVLDPTIPVLTINNVANNAAIRTVYTGPTARRPVAVKSSAYTLTSLDSLALVSGTTTITLPSAVTAGAGRLYTVKNTGTGTVTVASTAGTIDGATTVPISVSKHSLDLVSDGTNWWIV